MPRTLRIAAPLALAGLAIALGTPAALAQAPKVGGEYYEDNTDLGFKVKTPKGWEFIPPKPDELNLIGAYMPKGSNTRVQLSPGDWMDLFWWVVKFDRREGADKGRGARFTKPNRKDVDDWIKSSSYMVIQRGGPWSRVEEEEISYKKISGVQYEYAGQLSEKAPLRLHVTVLHLHPDVDLAFLGIGPGEKGKWRKYGPVFEKLAKSFNPVKIKEVDRSGEVAGLDTPLRQQKRAQLQDEVAKNPGWELYETPNYFVISNNDDRQFIKEVMERLEAIRAIFIADFPPEEAKALRMKALAEAADAEKDDDDPGASGGAGKSVVKDDPMEVARNSVVRICKDRDQYLGYGSPGMSVGYWSSSHKELVLYDSKKDRGRSMTWATLSHEAFHQFIYYFYGNIAPHSWYNEGSGDFYGGFDYKGGKFRPEPDNGNLREAQEMIRNHDEGAAAYAPLNELVRMTQAEYYGGNKYGIGGYSMYSQGWSLVWFLRTGKGRARGWNDAWNGILATYLETLLVTTDLDEAVDKAFAGVDWDELTECWLKYTK